MRARFLIAGVIASGGLGLAPVAEAHLPHTKKTAITGFGMAGVKLDMSRTQVFRAWGSTSCILGVCTWTGGPGKAGRQERATVSFVKGKVVLIGINAATTGNNLRFRPGFLSKWKTSRKISLGSQKKAVHKAYPTARANRSEGVQGYDLFGGARPDLRLIRFSTPGFGDSPTRLRSITVGWDSCHFMKC